ncbi:MAG TPA: nucleotidyl transferase AbiEii/AbiGii toxin family protein [Clostridia bacterium]|jgi:predicted nucleotidyltransferase component of viral defense system|nr:nucleotidyl transferase AbiEii/AbiGii toxin family protein [Clostridia bacterium]
MHLHENTKLFTETLKAVEMESKVGQSMIEKDYYVSLLLNELSKEIPNLIFKGGTSLSKCYSIIKRFSEDIDLTLKQDYLTQGNRVNTKRAIVGTCDKLGFKITNLEHIKSKKMFNNYKVEYPKSAEGRIDPVIKIDTIFSIKSFPSEERHASNIIYESLKGGRYESLIQDYNLEPFPIQTQTVERTFVDKIFALCDYYLGEFKERTSRHLYDLHKLYPKIKFDKEFEKLVFETRDARQNSPFAISANPDVNIYEVLSEIVDSNFYEYDYNNVTKHLLNKGEDVTYEDTVDTLYKIRDEAFYMDKPSPDMGR